MKFLYIKKERKESPLDDFGTVILSQLNLLHHIIGRIKGEGRRQVNCLSSLGEIRDTNVKMKMIHPLNTMYQVDSAVLICFVLLKCFPFSSLCRLSV